MFTTMPYPFGVVPVLRVGFTPVQSAKQEKADTFRYRLSCLTWWVTKESNLEPPD